MKNERYEFYFNFIGSFAMSFEGKVEEHDIEMDNERLEKLAEHVLHLLTDINFLTKMYNTGK